MIAVLLMLVTGIGPFGGVVAASHTCTTGLEASTRVAEQQHAIHLSGMVAQQIADDVVAFGSCTNCTEDCCASGSCQHTASCGGASAALIGYTSAMSTHGQAIALPNTGQIALSNRSTSPYRPPRV